ncbi:MAG TPA: hypothetical protein VFT42_11555 [Solirubrobacteraceae bacterium]|nr:hypothetical protein [Solirubrobacteraceae bacterium]
MRALAAIAAVAALFALPAPALAGDGGGQRAMSPDEIYALTCGHLGVSCAIARPHAHHARAGRARHRRAATARH